MASSKEYLDFILEQLSALDGVSFHPMMGEYILYYQGRVIGGIYDDRFLVKPTKSALALMPDADNVEDRAFLQTLFESVLPELPAPKAKKR